MNRTFFLLLIYWVSSGICQSQDIPVGSWRVHVSYLDAKSLSFGNGVVYTSSKNGIFSYDQSDRSIQTLTKIDGLSDSDITHIGYSIQNEMLLVGYRNGNIDIITDNQIINFAVIKNSSYPDKTINHFLFQNQTCFISTDFGIVVLDLATFNILDSYENIGVAGTTLKIAQSTIYQDSLFAASDNGIIAGWLNPSINLKDFNNWVRFDDSNNIPQDTASTIITFNGRVYAGLGDQGIYKYNSSWNQEPYLQTESVGNLSSFEQRMAVSTADAVYTVTDNQAVKVETKLTKSPRAAIIDGQGIWIADGKNSLVSDFSGSFESISASGPAGDRFTELGFMNDIIIGLPGGFNQNRTPIQDTLGFSVFQGGRWTIYNRPEKDVATDLLTLSYSNEGVTMGSFGDGITLWNPGEDPVSQNTNSETYPFNSDFVSASHASQNGSWICTYGEIPSVYSKSESGWDPIILGIADEERILEIIEDFEGNILFRVDPIHQGSIIVYNPSTKQVRSLNSTKDNGNLPSDDIWDLELDRKGNIWVGTDKGTAYFPRGFDLFGAVEAIRPIFEGGFLLDNQKISTIKTDGGNRKWFGTEAGAWLFGEFGEILYTHFTDDQPLLSNNITKIQIDDGTGEVFFATDIGLSSFRGNATEEVSGHENVKIFPNPVNPGYSGIVAIEGLPIEAEIKITDVAGNLIWQTSSFGGTATWNLITIYGNRPKSGMYMIYSTSSDGSDHFVGKLAIIN